MKREWYGSVDAMEAAVTEEKNSCELSPFRISNQVGNFVQYYLAIVYCLSMMEWKSFPWIIRTVLV